MISVLGLAAGLAAGGIGLTAALGFALERSADADARTTGDAIVQLAAVGALPDPLPVAGDDVRVQVVDGQGRVSAASIGADRLVPMLYANERARLAADPGAALVVPGDRLGMHGPVRVILVAAGDPADQRFVLVARSMADISRSIALVRVSVLLAIPLLVAGVAVVVWRAVGAALRPVERLRAGAAEITGGDQVGHLPVPDGGDEIHRLAVTLNDMLDRQEAGRARQRAFVADAAHELRSPLTNLRTELEVAQRLGERADWAAVAGNLLADSQRLARLVDDLLLLARADQEQTGDSAALLGAIGPVELGELIASVTVRYPRPPVRVVPPAEPLWIEGDPDALVRVLANLLDNAVRHAHSEVLVTARPGADRWHELLVVDDGPGIRAADRERVFDRFTRLDDARARDAGGAGLGLAIVAQLVRRHGGTIELADAEPLVADLGIDRPLAGRGLRAQVRFPAGEVEVDPDADPVDGE